MIFVGLYIAGSFYLILTQGLFGESFIAIILGLPWSFLLLFLSPNEAFGYAFVIGPIILNVALLYTIGYVIGSHWKAKPNGKIPLIRYAVAGFLFGTVGFWLLQYFVGSIMHAAELGSTVWRILFATAWYLGYLSPTHYLSDSFSALSWFIDGGFYATLFALIGKYLQRFGHVQ